MKLKDILNTEKRFNKLVGLLNKGSKIRLCNDLLVINKENDSFKINILNNNKDLIKDFLDTYDLKLELEGMNDKEAYNFIIECFLLNKDHNQGGVGELFSYYIEKRKKIEKYKKTFKNKIKENKYKDFTNSKYTSFLELGQYPFYRSNDNFYLNYILPGINEFIDKEYKNNYIHLLLIKCDLCNHIYDIIDFIDIKNTWLVYDLYFFNHIKHIKKEVINVNICNNCYNHFLNKKELMLRRAVN